MKFLSKYISNIPGWVHWSLLIFTGLIIIIFNDAFGENQPFIIFSLFYFLLLLFISLRWIFRQIKSIIQLKNEKTKTELLHLKSQVNPHFFFNTLNNLYGLVEKDPKKAQELILTLSDMMRYSVYEGQKEWVTLEEEIIYLKSYVELHKMRYQKHIDIIYNTNIKEPGYKVMPLLFILLVENAFKHGVERLRDGAYVILNITNGKNEIYFEISNNFEEEEMEESRIGIGLQNLKRRLEIGYPKAHKLSFSKSVNTYTAKLTLKRL